MDSMYQHYVKQSLWKGLDVWFQKSFSEGMLAYFKDTGIKAKVKNINDTDTRRSEDARDFLRETLDHGNPAALLLWQNSYKNGELGCSRHWMTVTGIDEECYCQYLGAKSGLN